jgi:GNAT superfamily N-acetyltransferase
MAIQLTREEYQNRFGVAPVLQATSDIDNEPVFSEAPVKMTQAEFDATYTPQETADERSANINQPSFPSVEGESPLSAGLKTIGNVPSSAIQLGKGLLDVALNPIDTLRSVFGAVKGAGEKGGREILERTSLKDKVGQVPESPQEQSFTSMMDFLKERYVGTENLQRTFVNDPTGVALDVLGLLTGGAAITGKTAQTGKAVETVGGLVTKPAGKGIEKVKEVVGGTPEKLVSKRADDIFQIESSYAKNRRINDLAKDGGIDSRKRIAASDVLVDAVDENGLIRTKQKGGAVDLYKGQTVDGFESVVRQNLVREGATASVEEIRKMLIKEVGVSKLEGADLLSSLRKIESEIKGLRLRADEFGNVPLEKFHDAKISATSNIDFTKPASSKYRRAIARAYKEFVENKSKTNVKEINTELAKYYDDIKRLENLDGRKVRGGKLGKHFAQVTGNIAGGAAGSALGPLGVVGGTIVGGEVSAFLKGKTLAKTFGKELGLDGKKNAILEAAKETAELPKVRDLKTPDVKVGAAKGVPKNKEILKLEKDISDNIKAQKKAISAKDFTLVEALKGIYDVLVESLVSAINTAKKVAGSDVPNKKGGFIKTSLASKSDTPQSKRQLKSSPSPDTTTKALSESTDLLTEAKKFKTADEFVKTIDDERITFTTKDGKGSVTVTESTPQLELVDDISEAQLKKLGLDEDDFISKIEDIQVDKIQQGKGVGTELMDRVIKEVLETGHDFVYLNASPMGNRGLSLNDLTKFYEKFGFKVIKKQGENNLMVARKPQLKEIWEQANN